jgi:hypothetical protein
MKKVGQNAPFSYRVAHGTDVRTTPDLQHHGFPNGFSHALFRSDEKTLWSFPYVCPEPVLVK